MSGDTLWTFTTAATIYGTPTYVQTGKGATKRVWITDSEGTLYCVSAETGASLWSRPTPNALNVSSTNYSSGVLYYTVSLQPSGQDSKLIGVTEDGELFRETTITNYLVDSSRAPLLSSGRVILSVLGKPGAPDNGGVWSLNTGTGARAWTIPSGSTQWRTGAETGFVDTDVPLGGARAACRRGSGAPAPEPAGPSPGSRCR
jgi:outer membrane protein assembly factor BamB